MSWAATYVGAPFRDGGRGPVAFDCWGLVRTIYADELGIDLPAYGEISARDLSRVVRKMNAGQAEDIWRTVSKPQRLDVVLMRLPRGSRIGHVGVVVQPGHVLHVEAASHAAIVAETHFSIRHRIAGYRRHQRA